MARMQPPVLSPYQSLMAATPVVHRSVLVDGRTTHSWEYGPSDAAATVLAVHGFRGDHHGLESVAAHLVAGHPDGVRVVVPDLPGFGLSDPLPTSDLDGYVHWLRGFRDALGLDRRTVVLGHSFGSIVVSAAVAAGLDTRLLVLVNPIAAETTIDPNECPSTTVRRSSPRASRWAPASRSRTTASGPGCRARSGSGCCATGRSSGR
jgi:pimeloyl-ACP methyl ester carboxylesterase